MKIDLPRGESVEIKFDKKVYSPAHSSIETVVLADLYLKDFQVIDVGCGSGVIGLSLKKLHPEASVICTDVSEEALKQTRENAKLNDLLITTLNHDLLTLDYEPDMIVANLPTYNKRQLKLETLYGPKDSYYASKDGLGLYIKLFEQAKTNLNPGGYLIVECQDRLQGELKKLSEEKGFHLINRTEQAFAFINPVR